MDRDAILERVNEAAAHNRPLALRGAGSRSGHLPPGPETVLDLSGLRGVIDHEPRELVVSVAAGTPLAELQATLAHAGQTLAADPPRPAPESTLGGALAAGENGPARPWSGTLRDAVLGLELINGRGECLRLGGRVIKNVAGYDLSRLQAGAWGVFGVLTTVHLRVDPLPEQTLTRCLSLDLPQALERMTHWQRRPLPLRGLAWHDGILWLRLAGLAPGVRRAAAELGGDDPGEHGFWDALRDRRLPFFDGAPLWRLSLPPAAPQPDLPGDWLIDWGGALRWYRGPAPAEAIRAAARRLGGWARPWGVPHNPYDDLPAAQRTVARQLKRAFDPYGLFNPHLLNTD